MWFSLLKQWWLMVGGEGAREGVGGERGREGGEGGRDRRREVDRRRRRCLGAVRGSSGEGFTITHLCCSI